MASNESDKALRRRTPEEMLELCQREERSARRGRLKIFLGFAAGVGKTFEMLTEANRRRQRGQDVVIGYIETHGRKGTDEQLGDLETIPRKKIEYKGTTFEEMDTDAVLARQPQWVLVDELAHTNVPGSEREKRWQEVDLLLDAGINVLSAVNVQHLESLNDTVYDVTGIRVRETVPDHVLKDAAEVVMVDITPRALVHRLERGDIYRPDKIEQAKGNWFREGNLNALREIALREIAHEVDDDFEAQRDRRAAQPWATKDRLMVCLSPTQPSLRLLRRGWRIARRLYGDCVAVYVESRPPSEKERQTLQNDFALADRLKIPVVMLHETDIAHALIRYAQENGITQIVMGHSDRSRWQEFVKGSIVNRITRDLRNIDLVIVAAPQEEG